MAKSDLGKAVESGLGGGGARLLVKVTGRRVVRAVLTPVQVPQAMQEVDKARLEHFLTEWAYWMSIGGGVRGYGGCTPGFIN